jgi:uncharacterized protein YjbI with pentapeptide repeats
MIVPDKDGIPTDEEVELWRSRWDEEWIGEVISIFCKDPQNATRQIARCKWYDVNGFKRWPYNDEIYASKLQHGITLDLRGCRIPYGTDLSSAVLTCCRLEGAILNGANLEKATFHHSQLHKVEFWDTNLKNAAFGGAHGFHADFTQADLTGANFEFADFSHARFPESFSKANDFMYAVNLSGIYFPGLDLRGKQLEYASFSGAELPSAKFSKANLKGADFSRARLDCADFSDSNLTGANLACASIGGSNFSKTVMFDLILRSSEGFAQCSTATKFDSPNTFLPSGSLETAKSFPEQLPRVLSLCSEIRLCFRDNGLIHEAAPYYEKEEYWRTRMEWASIGKWPGCFKSGNRWNSFLLMCRYLLAEKLLGYGERPGRLIGASLILILACAAVFMFAGYEYDKRIIQADPFCVNTWSGSIGYCLRFSVECFTTLGFAKMQPAEGLSHWVASLEGLVGVLFVAMATVTWARKAIRD